jgi:D-aminoacyl-tRNA deacylase
MRIVLQRVARAEVSVGDQTVAAIGQGVLLLVGVAGEDTGQDAERLAQKIAGLRIFEDPPGKMNLSLAEVKGRVLAVPQFTLLADLTRGRRPDFTGAADPGPARALFDRFCDALSALGLAPEQGEFGAHMRVALENDGPVTIILDSKERTT